MRIIVITGISGAGKSSAAKYLEDAGFFCIDNLPPVMLRRITEICQQSYGKIDKMAFVIDARGGELLKDFFPALEDLSKAGYKYEIIFMDAQDDVLIKRYKESRRTHPLSHGGSIQSGITQERKALKSIRDKADYVIDTSKLLPNQLKINIAKIISAENNINSFQINIVSFGFKYGIPLECDLVFDVRFLPNPYYMEELKLLSGQNKEVREFVLGISDTNIFLSKLYDMIDFLLPRYVNEGKIQLVIGIGCTGGRHRSVAIATELYKHLQSGQHRVSVEHRDIEKDSRGR
jgi:UPF0042 nucleotide-binding protein